MSALDDALEALRAQAHEDVDRTFDALREILTAPLPRTPTVHQADDLTRQIALRELERQGWAQAKKRSGT